MGEGERACTRQEKTKTPTEGERRKLLLREREENFSKLHIYNMGY